MLAGGKDKDLSTRDPLVRKRREMVAHQLRRRGITDERVLRVMGDLPREIFVETAFRDRAYEDAPLPLPERQTISQPYIVAHMLEAARLGGREKVLEIGTGSGYQTAILAKLVDRVLTVERSVRLGRVAEARLFDLGCQNVLVRITDGTCGWPEEAPFDAIIVSAAAPDIPPPYLTQLAEGGRLVIPVGSVESQYVVRVVRTKTGFERERLSACRFVKLTGRYGWNEKG